MASLHDSFAGVHSDTDTSADPFGLYGDDTVDCDLGIEEDVDGVRLTLSDWLAAEATYYRSRDTAAARFLAAQLDALREEAEALDALTVDQYEGRAHARQREHDERLKDQGYAMGRIDERAGPLR